jgi:hypothetical protein
LSPEVTSAELVEFTPRLNNMKVAVSSICGTTVKIKTLIELLKTEQEINTDNKIQKIQL